MTILKKRFIIQKRLRTWHNLYLLTSTTIYKILTIPLLKKYKWVTFFRTKRILYWMCSGSFIKIILKLWKGTSSIKMILKGKRKHYNKNYKNSQLTSRQKWLNIWDSDMDLISGSISIKSSVKHNNQSTKWKSTNLKSSN